MLHRGKAVAALEAKAERFVGFETDLRDALADYERSLDRLASMTREEIDTALAGMDAPGARPTAEHDMCPRVVMPFGRRWVDHEEARAWALGVLRGVPTVAVDGSQITPSKDFSMPVGAVQVGWFMNPHDAARPYVKDIAFDVLAPDELASDEEDPAGFPDWRVNARRFVLECEKLIEFVVDQRDPVVRPVCFFDGSLILSFVQHMLPERQRAYVDAVTALLAASEAHRVPVVGYVDTSYARDLVAMLDAVMGKQSHQSVSDGALLRSRMGWGDRSTAFVCARDDSVLQRYYEQVCFVYLKTTSDRPPARLEVPRWVVEDGELEHTVDVVRAECVVGNGYPYAVEAADAVAVITMQDRARFYRLFQEFAKREGLPLRLSRKAASKQGRR